MGRWAAASAFGLFAVASTVVAQQPGRVPRICVLMADARGARPHWSAAFVERLRELGYVEGRSIAVESLWAEGNLERFPALAADCVRRQPDVIVVQSTPGTLAAKQATSTIPIVMAAGGDAVGAGVVASLGRPGGNVTGNSFMQPDMSPKWAELLKELVPKASRLGFLASSAYPPEPLAFNEFRAAAQALGSSAQFLETRGPKGIEGALAEVIRRRAHAIFVLQNPTNWGHRQAILDFAARHRLPAGYSVRDFVEAGGLFSYGVHFPDLYRSAAVYVDKILKGAKPADLPVEQPTRFELVINMKTAKALKLTIPPSVLIRADQVIQ
jgi:putative ABC transport system substrate-binding protein